VSTSGSYISIVSLAPFSFISGAKSNVIVVRIFIEVFEIIFNARVNLTAACSSYYSSEVEVEEDLILERPALALGRAKAASD